MKSKPLPPDHLLEIVNRELIESQNRPLNSRENMILRGIWQYQTYNQIALEEDYSLGYFSNVVALELCRRLSQLIGQCVTKKNCRVILKSYAATQAASETRPLRQQIQRIDV